MNDLFKSSEFDLLFDAVTFLQDKQQASKFFEDLCTITELKSMAQRIQVAKLLYEKRKYTEISSITGASAATISRVARALNYGAGGYISVLEKLGEVDE